MINCDEGIKKGSFASLVESTELRIYKATCPNDECSRDILWSKKTNWALKGEYRKTEEPIQFIYPRVSARLIAQEVPVELAKDFQEAWLVLPFSTRASAALSRRCLEVVLKKYRNITKGDLKDKIDEALKADPPIFSEDVSKCLHALRMLGNFAVHPIHTIDSGETVDITLQEAELCLDVLEALFEEVFVQPTRLEAKLKAINEKVIGAGKSPILKPDPK